MLFSRQTLLALRTKLFSRRMFQRAVRDVVARNRLRPRYEILEERRVLATVTWDGGAGSQFWEDAANWSANALPTAADDVVIADLPAAGYTIVDIVSNPIVKSLVLSGTDVYTNQSSVLTVSASSSLTVSTSIDVANSSLQLFSSSVTAASVSLGIDGFLNGANSTITAPTIVNNHGRLFWNDGGNGLAGQPFVLNGNYTQGPLGEFIVGVDAIANTAEKIQITGIANLNGFITLNTFNNDPIDVSQSFTVLEYSSSSGSLAQAWYSNNYGGFELATPFSYSQGLSSLSLSGNVHVVSSGADSGVGSLRQAIIDANASLNPFLIGFRNIGSISLTSPLPNAQRPVDINATQIGGFAGTPLVELSGASAGAAANGIKLAVGSAGSIIKGLAINRFSGEGISIDSSNNSISNNFIGTDPLGTIDRGNAGNGIAVSPGANSNVIKNNLVSGNNSTGILLQGDGNKVQGNKVGTNAAGTGDLGNSLSGVWMYFGSSNFVGVDGDGINDSTEGNLISGNDSNGVNFQGNSDNNVVTGNLIGTNAAGTHAIPNTSGGVIFFNDFQGDNNRIGTDANGTSDDLERNVISGNANYGLVDFGVGTKIRGNYIGTKVDGLSALPNIQGGVSLASSGAIVGGAVASARNVISGNAGFGVAISDATGTGNTILGNYIGVDKNGNTALPNTTHGVLIQLGASGNTIGGTTIAARNVISGNAASGVNVTGTGSTSNKIFGNYIGIGADGSTDLGNDNGVTITDAPGNFVGSGLAGTGNIISGNAGDVAVLGISATGNRIQGNRISMTANGLSLIAPSFGYGVYVANGASDTVIGTYSDSVNDATEGNLIGFASTAAVFLQDNGAAPNRTAIAGNTIGLSASGSTMSTGVRGIWIQGATNTRIGTDANGTSDDEERNVLVPNLNGAQGILITGGSLGATTGTTIAGNYVGLDTTGEIGRSNNTNTGIVLQAGLGNGISNTLIGGTQASAKNVIGSLSIGIELSGALVSNNSIQGNYIGTDKDGMSAIPNNEGIGIEAGAASNTVGGPTAASKNVISGNVVGVHVSGSNGTTIASNFVGLQADGLTSLSNTDTGIYVNGNSSNTTIGGVSLTMAAANYIGAGGGYGIALLPTPGTTGNKVVGNFVGLNQAEQTSGYTLAGILLKDTSNITIGGTVAGSKNVISGSGTGVWIYNTSNSLVQGNFIGTDSTGEFDRGNQSGIAIEQASFGNTIGGLSAAARNVISGNDIYGVGIHHVGSINNFVQGNYIGTDKDGVSSIPNTSGIEISVGAANNTVGGNDAGARNIISGNTTYGLILNGTGLGNVVQGNWIGTNNDGTGPLSNGDTGVILGPGTFTIGGTADGAGNVISGNGNYGVAILGGSHTVQGNIIGLRPNGDTPLPNTSGVYVAFSTGNLIGGTAAGAGNVISGNTSRGVHLRGGSANTVVGNLIGTDKTGAFDRGNALGVYLSEGATGSTVGGTTADARNIISGNDQFGVFISDGGTSGNILAGNYIGTNAAGTATIANAVGVQISNGASTNTIGGFTSTPGTGAGNVISGNTAQGILDQFGAVGTVIRGNLVGLGADGSTDLGNGTSGIQVSALDTLIGGDDDDDGLLDGVVRARNVISGNTTQGINIGHSGSVRNTIVRGNFIGTNREGTSSVSNSNSGVVVGSAPGTRIGGTTAGAGNVISGNASSGLTITGISYQEIDGLYNAAVEGNIIGLNATGSAPVANSIGISIDSSTLGPLNGGNRIGGVNQQSRNVISGNSGHGIVVFGVNSIGNRIEGNYIGTDSFGTSKWANAGDGVRLTDGANGNTVGGATAISGNVIAGNAANGVLLDNAVGNSVAQNSIGINALGTPMPNALGVRVTNNSTANVFNDNQIRFSTGDNIVIESVENVLGRNVSADMGGLPIRLNPASLAPGSVTVSQVVSGANPVALVNVQGRPSTIYTVDLFSSPTVGQASRYLTSANVTTDASGVANNFPIAASSGSINGYVHATLTGLGTSGFTSTSGLSGGVLGTPAIIFGLPSQSPEGTPITLTAFSSTNVVTGYLWEVKKDGLPYSFELRTDGTQSDGGIQFTPDDEGNYTVSLRVTIADGTPNGTQFLIGPYSISVYNVAPTPSFSYTPTVIAAGTLVTLASNNSDPGQLDVLRNAWEVRSGSPTGPFIFSAPFSAVQQASFIPTAGGFYYATMTVNDGDGGIRNLTREIEVSGLPSTAATTIVVPNTAVLEGQTVRARAPESELNRSEQLTFTWTVSKKSPSGVITDYTSRITTPSRGVVEFIPDDDGEYTIGLTIGDGVGTVTAVPQKVTVSNVAPRVQITGGASNLTSGVPVTLGTSISDPGAADTHTIAWSVSLNGTPFGIPSSGSGYSFTPVLSGNYVVTATATDDNGGVGTTRRAFSLSASGISIAIIPPNGPFTENNTYNFVANVSPGTSTYSWTARNVTGVVAGTGSSPIFAFAPQQGGDYQIELKVTLADGRVGNAIYLPMIVIGTAPTIANPLSVFSPTGTIYEGTSVTVRTLGADPRETVGLTYQWSLKKPGQSAFAPLSGVYGAPTDFKFLPTDNGIYQVQVTITDSQGLSVFQSLDVHVQNADPLVRLDATFNALTPNDIKFAAVSTDPGIDDTPDLRYEWKINNGSYTALTATSQFTTSLAGLTNLTVRVTDGDGGVTLRSYFVIQGTSGNDTYTITGTNTSGSGVNDQILYLALDGNDTITIDNTVTKKVVVIAGNGNDTVYAQTALVELLLDGGAGNDTLYGGLRDDILIAGEGNNLLDGGNGNNRFVGGGSDRMKDGVGSSIFEVHFSTVALEDAGGIDTIDLTAAQAGVTLNISNNTGASQPVFINSIPPGSPTPPPYANSTLSLQGSFEKLIGSTFNDNLETNTANTEIDGGEGNDTIRSNASNTRLSGGSGNDLFLLSNASGNYDGGQGNDTVNGTLAANSTSAIATGAGNDVVNINGTPSTVIISGIPTTVYPDVSISLGDGLNTLTANRISGKVYGDNGAKGLTDVFGSTSSAVSTIDVSNSTNIDIFGTSTPGSQISASGSVNIDIYGSGLLTLNGGTQGGRIFSTVFGTTVPALSLASVGDSSNIDIFGSTSPNGPGLNVDVSGSVNIDIFGSTGPQASLIEASNSSNIDIFGARAGRIELNQLTGTNRVYISDFGTVSTDKLAFDIVGSANIGIFGATAGPGLELSGIISNSNNIDIFGSTTPIGTIRVDNSSENIDIFGGTGAIGLLDIAGSTNIDIFGSTGPIGTVSLTGSTNIDIFGATGPIGSIQVNGGSENIDIFGGVGFIGTIQVGGSTNIDIFGSTVGLGLIEVTGSQNIDIYGLVSGQVRMIDVNRNGVGTSVISSTVFGTTIASTLLVDVSGSQNIDIFGSTATTGPSLIATVVGSENIDIFGSANPGSITVNSSENIDIFGSPLAPTTIGVASSENIDIYSGFGDMITLDSASRVHVEGGFFGTVSGLGVTVTISGGSENIGIFGTGAQDIVTVHASSNVGVDLRGGSDIVLVDGAQHFVAITDDGVDRVTIRSGFDMLVYLGAGDDRAEVFGGDFIRIIAESGEDEMMLSGGSSIVLDGGADADKVFVIGGNGLYVRGDAGDDQVDVYSGVGLSVAGGIDVDRLRVFGSLVGALDAGKVYTLLDGQDGNDFLEVRPLLSVASRGNGTVASVSIPYLYIPSWMTIPTWISNPTQTTYASSIALVGGKGANTLYLEGTQRLYAIGGDEVDTITLQEGSNSEIAGGRSNDIITVNASGTDNRVFGDQDNDTINAYAGTRLGIFGEEGTDTIRFHSGQDGFARGGVNNDTLEILNGNRMVLAGESGNDTQTIWGGISGVAAGGIGDDTLQIAGGSLGLLLGQSGNDHLSSIAGTQSIVSGGDGDDQVDAFNRGDDLYGDDGDDTYVIHTSPLTSALRLRELIYVDPSDFEPESRGADTIDLSEFNVNATLNLGILGNFDDLRVGKDLITGLQSVIGTQLQLILFGSLENVIGTNANDTLTGNSESNRIEGRGGNDSIFGLGGDDTLEGGPGNDTADGGSGDDLYLFSTATGEPLGTDTIYEMSGGGIDGLDFSGMPVGLGSLDLALATQQSLNGGLLNLTLRQSTSDTGAAEVEEVVGTPLGETIYGNSLDNRIEPKGGNDIADGRTGSDIYVFSGRNLGSDQVIDAGLGTDRDTLDLVGFDAPVVLDLAVTSPQNMGELTLTLGTADAIENVLGSSFDDTIRGNLRDNALFGAAGADLLEGRAGNDRLVGELPAVVLLDFDSAYNASRGDYNYSTSERSLIEQRLTTTYAAFNWRFTQNEADARSWTTDMGRSYVRIAFSKGRGGGVSGDAGEVDFRNIQRRLVTEVNINPLLPVIREMLASTYTAQQYSDMVVAVTSTIAGHELAHTAGLRHGDSFGPIGSGMYAATDTTNLYPQDTRAKSGSETGWHLMASPASVGTPLSEAARATFFGEREAIKMAFNEIGRSRLEIANLVAGHNTIATAENLGSLSKLYVPNLVPTSGPTPLGGFAQFGQLFDVSAIAVVGDIKPNVNPATSEVDYYKIDGVAGDILNVELLASSIRPLRGSAFDGELRIFKSDGTPLNFNGTTLFDNNLSDDDFEGTKDATLLDVVLPTSGLYYISVGLSTSPAISSTGGRYELFLSRFRTGTGGPVVGDTLIGGAGSDLVTGSAANDIFLATGAQVGDFDTLDGKGGTDSLDTLGLFYQYTSTSIENVIAPTNVPPVAQASSVTTNEDTAKSFVLSDFGFVDLENHSPNSITISGISLASGDTLSLNGNDVSVNQLISAANIPNLVYTPVANANGSGRSSFTFKVNDADLGTVSAVMTINVTPVNDAPSFLKGSNQTVLEDAGAQSVVGWATSLSKGPSDESGQTLSFVIVSNSNAALFSIGPTVDAAGKLTYTSAPNANGSATVTLRIADNGGTSNGGVDTSQLQTFTINVTPVNDAPSATFNIPATSILVGSSFTVSLTNPVDPDTTTGFTYAFDVGGGYSPFVTTNSISLVRTVVGPILIKAKINDNQGGITEYTGTVNIVLATGSAYILNLTASGSLTASGNANILMSHGIFVHSNSPSAVIASGNARINVGGTLQVVGGISRSGNAQATKTGVPASSVDPLASLTSPSLAGLMDYGAVNVSGNSTRTLSPGVYTSIQLSGNAIVTMNPGTYIIKGGGFTVSGNATVSGSNLTIFNAGSNYNSTTDGGSFGGISLSGNGNINLNPPTTGPYSGILIYQSRLNTRAINISGNAIVNVNGTIYAANATLTMSGNGRLNDSLIVNMLNISGNVALSQSILGQSKPNYAGANANTLLAGDLNLYVNRAGGHFNESMLARIREAISSIDTLLLPYSVSITEVTDPSLASVVVSYDHVSASGTAADGVLGSYDPSSDPVAITFLQGWDWYTGSDPLAIGSGQYDFQTSVVHELGHALGLGHSIDVTSAMNAELSAGVVHRVLTIADLNVPSTPEGIEPLMAVRRNSKDDEQDRMARDKQVAKQPKEKISAAPLFVFESPMTSEQSSPSARLQSGRPAERDYCAYYSNNSVKLESNGRLVSEFEKPKHQRTSSKDTRPDSKSVEADVIADAVDAAITELYDSIG